MGDLRLDVPNAEYHADTSAVSKSQLDLIHRSPALLAWSQRAPVDEEAATAVNLGNAFECLLLEPERFAAGYVEAPSVDKRTKAGKAEWDAFVESAGDATVLSRDEMRRLTLMRNSVWAHPMAARVLSAEGYTQASYYWTDAETGIACRCRPDWMLAHMPMVVDVKTTADIGRFSRSVEDYRYYVQDAFYSDGLTEHYGECPHFLFLVVSTSLSAGRYPVHVYELDAEDVAAGREAYRTDLATYAQCVADDDWTHVEPLRRPYWARG